MYKSESDLSRISIRDDMVDRDVFSLAVSRSLHISAWTVIDSQRDVGLRRVAYNTLEEAIILFTPDE